MRKVNIPFIICLVLSMPVTAQDDSTAKTLDRVTVTATRKEQETLLVPYSTRVISSKYIQNFQSRSTPEALTGLTGIFVQKTNHGGGSPFLRGLTGNQTLIMVDGIRLNNSTFRYGPNQYLNTIDPFTISRVEVAPGTGSVQYGSDAMGGVLQVFTAEPQFNSERPAWSGKVAAKYMTSDMEKTARAQATYRSANAAATIGATYKNFGDLIGGDTTGKQSPSGYDEFSFDAKTKFRLHENTVLTLAHQFLQQQHVPVYHKVRLENFGLNEFDPQRRMLSYAKLDMPAGSGLLDRVAITASWQQTLEGRTSQKNGSLTVRNEKDKVNTFGVTTDIASRLGSAWSANSGIELYLDKVNSTTIDRNVQTGGEAVKRGLYPDGSQYGNYSIYSLHHLDFNKWIVEAGLRYNLFNIRIEDTTLGEVRIHPSSFVYNASLLYKLTKLQSVYFSFNTGYRAPNVDDMGTLGIVDFRYEVPTANLEPERSRTIELGYKVETGKISGSVSAYYMHLHNLITRVKSVGEVINGYPVYRKENVEKAYIKGIEAEINFQILPGWALTANATLTEGYSLSKNEPLRRIPPVNGRVMSSYNYKRWFACAEYLTASEQARLAQGDKDDNRIPRGGTPAWNVFNLYAGYQLASLKLNVAFYNVLNEDYRTHGSGINGVGQSGSITATLTIP